jgi:hypothetical protein
MNANIHDEDDTLDLSWIDEERQLLQCKQMTPLPMSSIRIQCIYVGPNKDIVIQKTHHCPLTICGNKSILSHDILAPYLVSESIDKTHYSLDQLLIYHINIDTCHLSTFLSNYDMVSLVVVSDKSDIVIEPSLPIFHSINEIFVFFKGSLAQPFKLPSSLKSISKRGAGGGSTKRVRISDVVSKQTRKTYINDYS